MTLQQPLTGGKHRAGLGVAIAALGLLLTCLAPMRPAPAQPPDTGVSGVYEVVVGVPSMDAALAHFAAFGFRPVAEATLTARDAQRLYGVDSAARSVRLQNGDSASHGLLRLIEWQNPLGPGVGYAPPATVGQRLAVMRTEDIWRLYDIFRDARDTGQPWLPIEPVYDDLYGMTEGQPGILNRRVGVREMAVYGDWFNHVFYQRYGYRIPGYGTVDSDTPLRTSEFTHHDFFVKGPLAETTAYVENVLGFKPESDAPSLDGDWLHGPQQVFLMQPGASHYYLGYVSPNNIAGKLKFFAPRFPPGDRSAAVRPGALGITMHTVFTPKLEMVHALAQQHGLTPSAIVDNEFGEASFTFSSPDGAHWQVLARGQQPRGNPVQELKIERTRH